MILVSRRTYFKARPWLIRDRRRSTKVLTDRQVGAGSPISQVRNRLLFSNLSFIALLGPVLEAVGYLQHFIVVIMKLVNIMTHDGEVPSESGRQEQAKRVLLSDMMKHHKVSTWAKVRAQLEGQANVWDFFDKWVDK